MRRKLSLQDQLILQNSSKHREKWEQAIATGTFWTCAPHPLGEGCQLFSPFFPLQSDDFPPSAINVHAITFHNQSTLQAPFHGHWSKKSGFALPHSPQRGSWSLGGPITPSDLSAENHVPWWLLCTESWRKPHNSHFRETLMDILRILGHSLLNPVSSTPIPWRHSTDTTAEVTGSYTEHVTVEEVFHFQSHTTSQHFCF